MPLLLLALVACLSNQKLAERALDDDNDGYFDPAAADVGLPGPYDCDDSDPTVNPESLWYPDADGDGFGDAELPVEQCERPDRYVGDSADCDDADIDVKPGVPDECNDFDDDCDGTADEDANLWYPDTDSDRFGADVEGIPSCTAIPGFSLENTDCDDTIPWINPAAAEYCDLEDDDCDGLVDAADDDYAGEATWYVDSDGDGFGDVNQEFSPGCVHPDGYSLHAGDCDDLSVLVHADAVESCENGIDEDCNYLDSACGIHDRTLATSSITIYSGSNFLAAVGGIGDFNGDGHADWAVAEPSNGGTLGIFFGSPDLKLGDGDIAAMADAVWTDPANISIGSALAALGDIDGDGFDDVLSGGQRSSIIYGFSNVQHAYVGTDAIFEYEDDAVVSAAALGDVSGDGIRDFALGRATDVYVVQGRSSRFAARQDLGTISTRVQFTANRYATNPTDASDFDGDGGSDFAIAYSEHAGGGAGLLVFAGADLNTDVTDEDYFARVKTEGTYINIGQGLAGGIDANGDGYSDLIVGMVGYGFSSDGAVGFMSGRATPGADLGPDDLTPLVLGLEGDYFGAGLGIGGDATGDGRDDVVIGNGGSVLVSTLGDLASADDTSDLDFRLTNTQGYRGTGSCALVPDVNGDGYAEIAIRTVGAEANEVYFLYGGP